MRKPRGIHIGYYYDCDTYKRWIDICCYFNGVCSKHVLGSIIYHTWLTISEKEDFKTKFKEFENLKEI